jgi:hypothetical protein
MNNPTRELFHKDYAFEGQQADLIEVLQRADPEVVHVEVAMGPLDLGIHPLLQSAFTSMVEDLYTELIGETCRPKSSPHRAWVVVVTLLATQPIAQELLLERTFQLINTLDTPKS